MPWDLNKVMIIGRITNDLDVKKIESTGSSVVNFNLATNRKYKNKEWNVMEEVEFHRCVAYWTLADMFGQYLEKGRKIYIEWRLKTRKWEDTNGTTRYSTEIVLEDFTFCDSKISKSEWTNSSEPKQIQSQDEDLPF